ncbi:hypothetical protein GWI33_007009 [Rhynchophorus ferrugineus]|uniref:Uncharacterized protein n=1 Tax=Rhynchophorus ferrugineus TaxID=354439 RepID=A0A834MGY8_RHYFE|nr:hypothetical protein GWI33_007009 [Rhynchophorus ferrugineus]
MSAVFVAIFVTRLYTTVPEEKKKRIDVCSCGGKSIFVHSSWPSSGRAEKASGDAIHFFTVNYVSAGAEALFRHPIRSEFPTSTVRRAIRFGKT